MSFKSLSSLEPHARQLAELSTAWADPFWDVTSGLLWYPGYEATGSGARRSHLVRDTVWYVVGLFLRRQGSDVFRALHAIEAILDHQIDAPGQPYHGTFARSPEEAWPQPGAREWRDYDPNWREFIITTLQIILVEYEPLLPKRIVGRIDTATRLAVAGALARPLRAAYTNIALMHAFMLCAAGQRLHEPAWFARGEQMAQSIYDLFQANQAFAEYNSPTYYGVDLYALALWRAYGPSPAGGVQSVLRRLGAEMEALLWTDISRFYHAGLRNLCGPFDRAYGMDMTRYAAVLAEWIWLVTGQDLAPFPDIELPSLYPRQGGIAHTTDFFYSPCAALLGAVVPESARAHFLAFQGPRQVEHVITSEPRRTATAWLEENFMWGAEHTSRSKAGSAQFHSVTLHWNAAPNTVGSPTGARSVGWMRLVHAEPVDAVVAGHTLTIRGSGMLTFQIYAPNLSESDLSPEAWTLPLYSTPEGCTRRGGDDTRGTPLGRALPSLNVKVSASPSSFQVSRRPEWLEASYDAGPGQAIQLHLRV